eukprot:sb/3478338/
MDIRGRTTQQARSHSKGGQHTPKLKLKLKFDVSGHNSAISWRNCFFLGLLEKGHQARSEELKKLEIRANCAATGSMPSFQQAQKEAISPRNGRVMTKNVKF